LIRELDLDDSERHEIRQILHEMVKSGNVIKLKGNRFQPAGRAVSDLESFRLIGMVTASSL
jgi:hypothetical protein